MLKDHDALIAAEQARIPMLRDELEAIRQTLVSHVARFLADWYPKRAAELIRSELRVAERVEPERLRKVERAVERLAARAGERAADVLGTARYWWHLQDSFPEAGERQGREESVAESYRFRHNNAPPALSMPLHELLEELAAVLQEFGFLHAAGYAGRSVAPFAMCWSPEIVRTADEYANRGRAVHDVLSRIAQLRHEREFERMRAEDPYWFM